MQQFWGRQFLVSGTCDLLAVRYSRRGITRIVSEIGPEVAFVLSVARDDPRSEMRPREFGDPRSVQF